MTSRFANLAQRPMRLRPVRLVIAGLAALSAAADQAGATSGRSERAIEAVASRAAGEPVMAIVSLRNQRITVYDADGWILRAPVSSGQKGRETPSGVFSVLQKNAEHYSNLYEDAYMPHMQRLTWSGIALHGGLLPGYPASHGCVRLPFDFAERLFGATRLGMRVIVTPSDVAPVEIAHPALFRSKPRAEALIAALAAEAEAAARKADQARLAAVSASREAAQAMVRVRVADNLQRRAEAQLAAAQAALDSAISAEAREIAEDAKAKAIARITELQAQWVAAKAEAQPKLDAVAPLREAAVALESVRVVAAEAVRQAARELDPVSVFISRKSARLYVRRAFQPVLESPVTILDADRPIGTHVFTALARTDRDSEMRWSVVSLDRGRPHGVVVDLAERTRVSRGRDAEPMTTHSEGAKTALDRIVIPQDTLDRIAEMAAPRSSLIISDEALSSETGNETEFVVVLSGEPQGSLKIRRAGRPRDRLPFAGSYSTW